MTETSRSRLPLWLVASLLVNALLIGFLIGGGLGRPKASGSAPSGGEMALAHSIDRTVPEQQRVMVRRALRQAFDNTRTERAELRRVRRELGQLMTAEPYDLEAVTAAFSRLRAADGQVKVGLHEELAKQLGELSIEQRREIIRGLERGQRFDRGQRRNDRQRRMRRRGDSPPPPED